MLTIVMLCYVNHCHAIMDIIKNISDTLNQEQIVLLLILFNYFDWILDSI